MRIGDADAVPTAREVHRLVELALSEFVKREATLVICDPSERSLTHRFAIHIEAVFLGWDVDCEFNRDGDLPKRLVATALRKVATNSDYAVTVFPDIIVHRRGKPGPNLLVIEAKKATSHMSNRFDLLKLAAYKEDLGYQFAVFIVLPAGKHAGCSPQWI